MNLPTDRPPTGPGEILKELFLDPAGITQAALAAHLGWTVAKVSNIINGKNGITADSALALADALGTTPDVWLNAQNAVDLFKARQKHQQRPRLIQQAS